MSAFGPNGRRELPNISCEGVGLAVYALRRHISHGPQECIALQPNSKIAPGFCKFEFLNLKIQLSSINSQVQCDIILLGQSKGAAALFSQVKKAPRLSASRGNSHHSESVVHKSADAKVSNLDLSA